MRNGPAEPARGGARRVERFEQPVASRGGAVAEAHDRARAGVGNRAAEVEDRDLAADAPDRVDQPRDVVEGGPAAEDDRPRLERADRAAEPVAIGRGAQRAACAARRDGARARAPGRGASRDRAGSTGRGSAGRPRGSRRDASRLCADSQPSRVAPGRIRTRRSCARPRTATSPPATAPPRPSARPSAARGSPRAGGRRAVRRMRRKPRQGGRTTAARTLGCARATIAEETLWVSSASGAAPGSRRACSGGGRRRTAAGIGKRVAALPAAERVALTPRMLAAAFVRIIQRLIEARGRRCKRRNAPCKIGPSRTSAGCHDFLPMTTFMRLRLYHHPDGARVAYRETGTGPAIVLLHSLGLSHREWEPIVARLAQALPGGAARSAAPRRLGGPPAPPLHARLAGRRGRGLLCRGRRAPRGWSPVTTSAPSWRSGRASTGRLEPSRLVLMPNRLHRRDEFPGRRMAGGSLRSRGGARPRPVVSH